MTGRTGAQRKRGRVERPNTYDHVDQLDAISDLIEAWPGMRPLAVQLGRHGHGLLVIEPEWFWRIVDATRKARPDATCSRAPMVRTVNPSDVRTVVASYHLGGDIRVQATLTRTDRQE